MKNTKQENDTATIQKAKRKFALGCILALLGAAALFAGVALGGKYTWGFIGGFLVCMIGGLVLMIQASPGMSLADSHKIEQEYGEAELTQLHGMGKNDAEQTLCSHGFEMDDAGYYSKKQFSPLKDSITYCVKLLDSTDMENTVQDACDDFDERFQSENTICLLLLVYSREPEEQATDYLRRSGMIQIENGTVHDRHAIRTLIVVGVDPVTGVGQYLDIGESHRLCLYSFGCKMLRNLFGQL